MVVHKLADQVGNLNPGQYITPKLMFPPHTLNQMDRGINSSWVRFGESFADLARYSPQIFGLFIVGRIVWYTDKGSHELWLYSRCPCLFATPGVVILHGSVIYPLLSESSTPTPAQSIR